MKSIQQILIEAITSPWFVLWLGAICGYMLSLYPPNAKGCQEFLYKMFPKKRPAFYAQMEFLLLPIIVAFISLFMFDPTNVRSAFLMGLSWDGVVMVWMGYKSK